ncbi:myosin-3-like isoform X2 [Silurus meridionalis]|uniref:Uncharacterized protein n=1 Tax=Silurus meridionalis TaxID=175797 RepID=A0A8T0B2X7_SILME|nr:myosin-3-like isoform X2 [Silurus meridionalis]KAF7700470.1 hypothetical protein HF521_003428 [Silurus meridionalis]
MNFLRELVGDVPLRPLLFVTGAAAATAAIYWCSKGGHGEERRTEENTSAGPVCDPDGESALVQPTEVPQNQDSGMKEMERFLGLEDSVKKLEDIVKRLEDVVKRLEDIVKKKLPYSVKKKMEDSVKKMEDFIRELGEMLVVLHKDWELKSNAFQPEAMEKENKSEEVISNLEKEKTSLSDEVKTLQNTVQEMKNQLCKSNGACDKLQEELENQKEAHSNLQFEYDQLKMTMTSNEELQKLEKEKAILSSEVKALQDTVQEKGNLLFEINRDCDKLQEISDAQFEEKVKKAEETIAQLESKKFNLTDSLKTLRDTGQEMRNQLCGTNGDWDKLQEELENQKEAHSNLQFEYDQLKMTMTSNEELQKVSLDEAEEKLKKAEEFISQLEKEKNSLSNEVKTLRDTVQEMGNLRCEINRQCGEIKKEFEGEQDLYSRRTKMINEMKETLMEKEASQQVFLAVNEEKHQMAAETIVELECEKVHLSIEVKSLWESVQEMGNLLCETNRDYKKLTEDFESAREAHTMLQVEYDEFKTNVLHKEEFLKASVDEAVEKQKAAEEIIAHLESVKVDLSNEVLRMQDSLEDMGKLLFESNRDFADLTEDLVKEREAYCILQSDYDDLKNLQKISLAESEEVKRLRNTLEEVGNLLADSNIDCDELKLELEREQKAHFIIQSEYDELKKTLLHYEELLKVYEDKCEEKNQEVIAQLVNKNVNLSEQVEILQGTVEDYENMYIRNNKECFMLLEDFRKKQVDHHKLQFEHNEMMKTSIHNKEALINEFESMQDAHYVLQAQHKELIKTILHNEELLQEYEREQEAHSVIQFKYDTLMEDMMQKQEQMKVSLDKAMKHQKKNEETIAKLNNDKLDLIEEVKCLLLCDTHLEYNILKKEFEEQKEAHSKLQIEYNELKKSVMYNE